VFYINQKGPGWAIHNPSGSEKLISEDEYSYSIKSVDEINIKRGVKTLPPDRVICVNYADPKNEPIID